MRSVVLQALLIAFSCGVSCQAMAIECGGQPQDVPVDIQEQLSGDIEGKAQLFTKLFGDASLTGKVNASKEEIYQKYNNLDKAKIDKYLIWVSCQTINEDKTLNASQKLSLYLSVYKEIESPPPLPPPPKPQPYTIRICTGQYESNCPSGHNIFKTCGYFGSDDQEAAAACKGAPSRSTRIKTTNGNKCGYSIIEATCN